MQVGTYPTRNFALTVTNQCSLAVFENSAAIGLDLGLTHTFYGRVTRRIDHFCRSLRIAAQNGLYLRLPPDVESEKEVTGVQSLRILIDVNVGQ